MHLLKFADEDVQTVILEAHHRGRFLLIGQLQEEAGWGWGKARAQEKLLSGR